MVKNTALSKAKVARKIRIGILTGKNFDPIPVGTHDRKYPKKFRFLQNTGPRASGWGGQFHIDVSTGLKMGRLHPDIFEVDIISGRNVTPARLARNHLNLNFWYEVGLALLTGDKKHAKQVMKAQKDPNCRHYPPYDYYDWVVCKPRYMKQCIKAGLPLIDTIFVDKGLKPRKILTQVQSKGWDRFFIKAAHFSFFGNGAIHGRTEDFSKDISPLTQFVQDNKDMKLFLVQPFVVKPNGEVFDEIRNFFIDGEWAYSVFTHGTDYDAVYEQPDGFAKQASKDLALRAYDEVRRVAKWHGRPIDTLLSRVDIGMVPDRSHPGGTRFFLNEIELEMCTWLARYCPFNLCNRMAVASVKKARELLHGMLEARSPLPDAANVKRLLGVLDERLGPLELKRR